MFPPVSAIAPRVLFEQVRNAAGWVLGGPALPETSFRAALADVEAIERALENEAGCEPVMHLIAGARGAMAGLMAEVVEDHIRTHLVDDQKHPGALNGDAAGQLLDVIRTYLK